MGTSRPYKSKFKSGVFDALAVDAGNMQASVFTDEAFPRLVDAEGKFRVDLAEINSVERGKLQ